MQKEIIILPIGGVKTIGANCTMYYYDGTMVLVDYGVGITSIDMYTPYDSYIYDINNIFKYFKANTLNLIITHIHEDHIGGIWFLLENFKYYNSININIHIVGSLARDILDSRMNIEDVNNNISIINHDINSIYSITPNFCFKFLPVDHSVPEANGVLLFINKYRIFHTGDWNINQYLDAEILNFSQFEDVKDKLNSLASTSNTIKTILELRNNCDLVVGESTKIGDINYKVTESLVTSELYNILKIYSKKNYNRIFITCFSSQIERISGIIRNCMELNLPIFIFGKSMSRVLNTNFFKNKYEKQFKYIKFLNNYKEFHQKYSGVYLISGSQNEYNSVLYQLINYYANFFNNKDLIIFSSPIIPGSYKQIEIIANQLIYQKVKLLNVMINNKLHASGHAIPSEIQFAYKVIQPNTILPVHGNTVKIQEHIHLAMDMFINTVNLRSNEALHVCFTKDNKAKLTKTKVPMDVEDLHVRIGQSYVRASENVVDEKLELIKGGIMIIINGDIHCCGFVIHDSILTKIKKDIDRYDLKIQKSKEAIIKRIKTKYSFYGLIKIIH